MTLRSRMLLRLASLLGASLEDVANDAELMEALEEDPDFFAGLTGFTYYSDNISTFSRTGL